MFDANTTNSRRLFTIISLRSSGTRLVKFRHVQQNRP